MFNNSQSPKNILATHDHRPWTRLGKPWMMGQSWCNLLFAHWKIPVETLQPLLPSSLTLDTYEGEAWIAVVPFHMKNIRARGLPPVPFTSALPELNVRTYVTDGNKQGVYFFSLDAMHRLAVETARNVFHLPYFMADMAWRVEGETVHYTSTRTDKRTDSGVFRGWYRPISDVYHSQPNTLEHWLTERYCMYAEHKGKLYRGEIHHAPWKLQRAEADIFENTVTNAHGIILPDEPPLLHYIEQIDVLAWLMDRV